MNEPTAAWCDAFINNLTVQEDVRESPDANRLRNFLMGWDAAVSDKQYGERAMSRLTWQNLGARLGEQIGDVSHEEQERYFDAFSEQYVRSLTT